ncbi:hypothetical protein N3K66_001215 [Trichothecium roseum]|uniref:Uncharacterized protein n=1 Tax=Trichothecium roseum TaxID=47278 RepID=A0ACC0VFM0_9HYPO|nr:hypothetical protein N3K66_001215 [Trichothecium roseum]
MASDRLNVIALISGGKDSFFSLLHCINHGHRIIALANLHPATSSSDELQVIQSDASQPNDGIEKTEAEETDLNSFMYQTVGHEIIPLYAAATGLPLYRQPIHGSAVRHERDYDYETGDETESMLNLLAAVKEHHPEANAVSAGAILSTYQRTRVESVALRLGLTPLAFLWKYPVLPEPSGTPKDDAQLLLDMAAAALEARIIKVASAGLAEGMLWERASDYQGAEKIKRSLRKFGAAGGAVLGEGGEFETIVVDGPKELFRKRITIPEGARKVVNEGGGTVWLSLERAQLEDKAQGEEATACIRVPDQWDVRFRAILDSTQDQINSAKFQAEHRVTSSGSAIRSKSLTWCGNASNRLHWSIMADVSQGSSTIQEETVQVVAKIRSLLVQNSLESSQISNTIIILRHMSDFPKVNGEYGKLFTKSNPPSRVTISCGDLLPGKSNIGVFLSIDSAPQGNTVRQGLHVQSRSYWAPANIGPYSQAIGTPMSTRLKASEAIAWCVAGQIPLVPATMALPSPSDKSLATQITLSLQHLWRIGSDLKIQYWTSAVAYFARSTRPNEMERNAIMAGRAWGLAHGSPDEEADDASDDGPDPWDLKYNAALMSLASDEQRENKTSLPDWSILTLQQQNEPQACIPPVFAVEVQELPRQSAVEWHAHLGISQLSGNSVRLIYSEIGSAPGWRAWHFVAKESGLAMVHTVVARAEVGGSMQAPAHDDMALAYRESLVVLGLDSTLHAPADPYIQYLDTANTGSPGLCSGLSHASIPCYSIWSATGERYLALGLYRAEMDI